MQRERLLLRCPHCGTASSRSASFVAVRRHFVCKHCHEIVRIDAGANEHADARERSRVAPGSAKAVHFRKGH
jgi:endogenous inhibitor of DNA gyrase (YacG/DUF329 family)